MIGARGPSPAGGVALCGVRRGEAAVHCYATGGAAGELAVHLAPPVEVVDNLVLEGALALVDA